MRLPQINQVVNNTVEYVMLNVCGHMVNARSPWSVTWRWRHRDNDRGERERGTWRHMAAHGGTEPRLRSARDQQQNEEKRRTHILGRSNSDNMR